jgi:hypothetical protein
MVPSWPLPSIKTVVPGRPVVAPFTPAINVELCDPLVPIRMTPESPPLPALPIEIL